MGMEEDGWEDKREVEAVLVVGAVEDTTEKEQMGIRTKNNLTAGRKTILEPDDEVTLSVVMQAGVLNSQDKQELWSVCVRVLSV